MENLVKEVLIRGGSIHPLVIPSNLTNGTGTFNPSIYNDNGKLIMNMRHCQVTLFHSEKRKFIHEWGPVAYLNPENDITLTTTNYYCELNGKLEITKFCKVDFSKLDSPPIWEFRGLEDARVFRWEGKLYYCGVRRDTTTNGQGRMELCEIQVDYNGAREVSRFRIPCPGVGTDVHAGSYCEKNWMPVIDKPYHFVKWCNPVEIVKVDPVTKTCSTAFMSDKAKLASEQRGGSQLIPIEDGYLCITHEVVFYYGYRNENNKKDATYRHRILKFNKDLEIVCCSDLFSFMNAEIEFCAGMAEYGDDYLITFGVTDNASYILRCPKYIIKSMING